MFHHILCIFSISTYIFPPDPMYMLEKALVSRERAQKDAANIEKMDRRVQEAAFADPDSVLPYLPHRE
jgi:hypothetical protein